MDGVRNEEEDNVLVLGATNYPWELDAAIRRRFEKRVYISLPDSKSRAIMVKLHLRHTPNNLTESDFDKLGRMTEGASGSDIGVLVREALMEPVRKYEEAQQFLPIGNYLVPCEQYPNCPSCPPKLSTDPPNKNYDCSRCGAKRMQLCDEDVPSEKFKIPDVCVKDFESVLLGQSHSSVSDEDLEGYENWTRRFDKDGA